MFNYQSLELSLCWCKHRRDIDFNLSCFSVAEVGLPSRTHLIVLVTEHQCNTVFICIVLFFSHLPYKTAPDLLRILAVPY